MKIFKTILLLIGILLSSFTFAEDKTISIIDLDSSNSNLLKVYFDKDIQSNFNNVEGDIKIFKDLKKEKINKDLIKDDTINLILSSDLEKNTSYSLLSIYGVEGTIDFNIGEIINGLEIQGNNDNGIKKIEIIDKRNIKVIFTKDIISDDIDIKLLKEFKTDTLLLNDNNKKNLLVKLKDKLDPNSNYLVMFFSITIKEGDTYTIDNYIYDFNTKSDIKEANIKENKIINEDKKTGNIALNSAETPDTGAETWILLFATFLLSNFIYFKKKFSK